MVEESQEANSDFIRSQIEDAQKYYLKNVGEHVGEARKSFRRGTGETSVGSIKVRIMSNGNTSNRFKSVFRISIRCFKKCKNIV